jgi:hypothetical protein
MSPDSPKDASDVPSPKQVLFVRVRRALELYERRHRQRCGGGWKVPSDDEVYAHLSALFGLTRQELSLFMTYSRQCTHPWRAGACSRCPERWGWGAPREISREIFGPEMETVHDAGRRGRMEP